MAFLHNLVRCCTRVALRTNSLPLAYNLNDLSRCSRLAAQQCTAQQQQFRRTITLGAQLQQDIKVTFVRANGEKIQAKAKVGDTLLDVVVNNQLDLDGFGACEGTLTCSTCHLIFKADDYEKLPDKPSDEEMDMLDLAYELTDTSRLGCQITLTKEMDGLTISVPATINDARSA